MKLTRASTGTPWERQLGYARAVRGGDIVAVSATSAADEQGQPVAADAYGQARAILRIIGGALEELGSGLGQVLRVRVYYANPDIGDGTGRALLEAFPAGVPALSAVRVAALHDPRFLLEMEADALAGQGSSRDPERREWDEPVD